jgi:hypothetical protein
MPKRTLLILLIAISCPLEAEFKINAGLSGSWHDPAGWTARAC